jgi:hypothetical protein
MENLLPRFKLMWAHLMLSLGVATASTVAVFYPIIFDLKAYRAGTFFNYIVVLSIIFHDTQLLLILHMFYLMM